MYEVPSISFQTFFVQEFKIVVDSWKFSILLLYILWDDWPMFMISGSNELLQQQLECTLLKPDCHSWWISKMQSGRQDTLEERAAIKFCFKLLDKSSQWKHAGSLRPKKARQSKTTHKPLMIPFLTALPWSNALRSHWTDSQQEILFWGFNGVQEEIKSEKASTLKIGSVAFPAGRCTSPQLHPDYRLLDQDGHQDSFSASL